MAYTDLTSSFIYRGLLTSTRLDQLAENDDFDRLVSTTAMVFFQASAPTGWTKDATNDDAAFRIVTGGSGGTTTNTGSFSAHAGHTHTASTGGPSATVTLNAGGSGISVAPVGHTHTVTVTAITAFKFLDAIVCTRD